MVKTSVETYALAIDGKTVVFQQDKKKKKYCPPKILTTSMKEITPRLE